MTIKVGDEVSLCNLGTLNGLRVRVKKIVADDEGVRTYTVIILDPTAVTAIAWHQGDELDVHRYELESI